MPLSVVTSERFTDHVTPPGHPERPERAEVMQHVADGWARGGGRLVQPREAGDVDLGRVHTAAYLRAVAETRGRAAMLDPDTFTSPDSEHVARLAAGAVLTAIDDVLDGAPRRAVALVRPPGHHAEPDRAMGFCLYNNIAVGAAYARAKGVARLAIVDFDVHHGNGTEHMFECDPTVLFMSSHQHPFYPGTGASEDVGLGAGAGFTVNMPLDAGATDADVDLVYRQLTLPILEAFNPDLLLVSAGFDAHERDPLAGLRMTTEGFSILIRRLLHAADTHCEGRIVFVTEGGYDATALGECCQQLIDLASARSVPDPASAAGDSRRGERTVAEVRRVHGRWQAAWP
ncbi:MAG: histone deacetylase family protein [Acidobacteriota bacterium]